MTPDQKLGIAIELASKAARDCAVYLVYSKDDPDEMGRILENYVSAGGGNIRRAFYARNTKTASEMERKCYEVFYHAFRLCMFRKKLRTEADDGTVQAAALLMAGKKVYKYSAFNLLHLALATEAHLIRSGELRPGTTELATLVMNDTAYNALFC